MRGYGVCIDLKPKKSVKMTPTYSLHLRWLTYRPRMCQKLSAHGAAFLWLAAEIKAPLATFDEQLGRAAQVHLASLT